MMEWLYFHEAVNEIKHQLRVSPGEAQVKLRQLCASGKIRSQKEPYSIINGRWQDEGPPEGIEPSEWRDHEIDMMTDSDGCKYFVRVSKEDFWHQFPPSKEQTPAVGKQPRILKLLADKFGNSRVPDRGLCPRKVLKADLLKLDPTLNPLNLTTLKTAIETHNRKRS
jgi:hypothetical protein